MVLTGRLTSHVNAISNEGSLFWFWFSQLLIEHYLNIPYVSNALNAYAHLMQGENKMVMQYLTRAKVLLECIQHTSKLCDIPENGWDNLYLVQGLSSSHIL